MDDNAWIVGFHAVLALLKGDRPVDAVWVQQGRKDQRTRHVVEASHARGIRVDFVPRTKLDRIADAAPHNGCAARASVADYQPMETFLKEAGKPGRVLLLDHILDPHNIGAILRSAVAFAVDGVIIAGPTSPPLGGTVSRASAGHIENIKLARAKVAADALVQFRDAGYWIYGADMQGDPVEKVRSDDRWVLCVGAEEKGLRAKTRSVIDEMVKITMAPEVESLNVSVSTGILLYQLSR
jgi:23S rRNA (guanosine2251-2'-O)-methyltransferase